MENNDAQRIFSWLNAHPFISISAVCNSVGYDRHSFEQAVKGKRKVPKKYLPKFEKVLQSYGYKKEV